MDSDLVEDFRLVALDLRGHGLSDKPSTGYTDSGLWADDVHAVIGALSLDRPLLCGWSYGPIVILDYVRQYGEEGIGGVIFVGGVTKLGSDDAVAVITPEFLQLLPGMFATDVEESVRSLASLIRLCFAQQPSDADLYRMLGYNVSVPPYVRQAMFARSFSNDDLLRTMRKPVLITQGVLDAIVKPAAVDQHKASIAHAQIEMMSTGHAVFWEDAAGFNRLLRTFAGEAK
jgi:non-heme chloroperoxidase